MTYSALLPEGVTNPPAEDLSAMSRALVAATFHQDEWEEVLEMYGPLAVVTVLKRVLADIGSQEQKRTQGLAALRFDSGQTSRDDYRNAKRNYHHWKRSIEEVRQRLRLRIAEVQPLAQALVDEHQADRRALVVLAKRVWLWEEGRDDRLDYALDELTVSGSVGDPTRPRQPLREVVERIEREVGVLP